MTYQFLWRPTPSGDARTEWRRIALFALGVGSVFVASILVQIILVNIFSAVNKALLSQTWFLLLLSDISLYGVGMVTGWLFLRMLPKEPFTGQKYLTPLSVLTATSVSLSLLLIGSNLSNYINTLIESATGAEQTNPVESMTSTTPIGVIIIFTVILAPLAEEIFFRKIICDRLRRYGDIPAVLVSALVFGLAHGNFSQFFYAFFLGLVFGALYCKTGHIRYGLGLHVFINFFGSVYSTLLIRRVGDTFAMETLATDPVALGLYIGDIVIYGLSLIGFVPSLIYLIKRFRPKKKKLLSGGQWARVILLNPAVWLDCVVFTVIFVSSI